MSSDVSSKVYFESIIILKIIVGITILIVNSLGPVLRVSKSQFRIILPSTSTQAPETVKCLPWVSSALIKCTYLQNISNQTFNNFTSCFVGLNIDHLMSFGSMSEEDTNEFSRLPSNAS